RVKVLVLDDSVISRNRSKQVELLTKLYDHAQHRLMTKNNFYFYTYPCENIVF
ncbi:MAG: hypothetical protein PWP62_2706, partial [Eubacteriaceae bacterium]|nr:hypothetical protein [Eubacteriaceae bacterium]